MTTPTPTERPEVYRKAVPTNTVITPKAAAVFPTLLRKESAGDFFTQTSQDPGSFMFKNDESYERKINLMVDISV